MAEVFARAVREHHAPLIPRDEWSRYFHAMNILDCAFLPTVYHITEEYIHQNDLRQYNVPRRYGSRTDRAANRGVAAFNASANIAKLDHDWCRKSGDLTTVEERRHLWSAYIAAVEDIILALPENLQGVMRRSPLSPGTFPTETFRERGRSGSAQWDLTS
ncbi:hypothetical protein SISNIDRAFT_486179 [Sistotremastrum niveocremeum HHB9708]|uniref:Uncharacterized protein n=1 Tax=Sistotremastrum niveocremeum HHB9708 TaxID=1314777 RepID=A0A164TV24_9AGAM|nr:hypothetical protein SISNIDRAFT_486179 [Sistotremastrum niveocremeum HHB9708]